MSPRGKPMTKIFLRAPDELVERLDRLVERFADDDRFRYGGLVGRSTVLRIAVLEGVRVLESEAEE